MRKLTYLLVLIIILSYTNNKSSPLEDSNINEIANYLDSLDGFSGAVLIAKNGSVLFKKAYGFAHLGHKVKNRTDTKFNQGSIGKTFTAVAILQLIQQKKIKLTDKIGDYLPNYPNKIARDSVTIAHLLTHTSGLPHFFARKSFINGSKDLYRFANNFSSLYENEPMESKPGEIFSYRNTNYLILGRIIETVTGKEYNKYLESNIYSAASMENTGNYDLDHPINNAAEGYTTSEVHPDKLKINIHTYPVRGGAHGGGYTTLDDLYKFSQALQNYKLLNGKYTSLYTTPLNKDSHYGYGMQFSNPDKGTIYGHTGGHYGVGNEWRVYKQEGYTVIILTNKDANKGFLDARYFIEKTIAGSTPKLDNYFFTKKVIKAYLNSGLEQAKATIKNSKFKLSEIELNTEGYEMIKRGFYKKAIDLFTLEVLFFPESYDAYDSLGEAYMENGQIKKAIKNYQKSLKLNPDNTNAVEKLKELKSI
ncbi:CubicO group peptidase (beta-lactamase class C family) [Tenacibaculum gallaicum]|uniref:CubicO group peptidase (Beta-lactamase class C family) n=1 Tax=Tenacibaculum gallaicum TaxID=561505 RepID=A0A3E0I138_9FLAO|nr:serine hydrolase [Tenacibaculum gallaicum]REH52429.1 CubicO group peptidase (beta-lactamase class C family) [Tenacibaculum gallaicum]